MAKVVVFGADGFIGKHLVKKLSESSDNIVAFDRFSQYKTGLDHPFHELPNVNIVAGDFFNRDDLASALDGADYVFHLVSTTNPASSNDDPFVDIDTNVRGSVQLFELCVEKGVKKVIFPSSGGTIYGDIDSPMIGETTAPEPRSPYGIGKLTIEGYLRYFNFTSGLEYIVYRVANPYGPGQNIYGKQGVIPIFMHRFLNKEPLTIYGDGSMIRDYIFIDDLVDMIVGSYKKDSNYRIYNLGSGMGKSVNQIVEAIESCTNQSAEKVTLDTPQTFVDKSVLDISRFIDEFGITPKISLEEGVLRTWNYVQEVS